MDNLKQELSNSINKGIVFLSKNQLSNGEFSCYFSNNHYLQQYEKSEIGWYNKDSVVFITALIGNSLLFLADVTEVDKLLDKVATFLLVERKTGSVWNHFTRNHWMFPMNPYDVDDTACASSFLEARNIQFPSNKKLLLSNMTSKKLFYTWFTLRFKLNLNRDYLHLSLREFKNPVKSFAFWLKMECSRGDVDAVVNANALYYLGESDDTKHVIDYLNEIIKSNLEDDCDKWYRNVFTVYYFFSRNYYAGMLSLEPMKQVIIDRIFAKMQPNGCIGDSALDTALATCTLLNLKYNKTDVIQPAITYLLSTQAIDGSWERVAYYYGGPKKLVNWGGEELTTGVCLEALARYKKLIA